MTETAVEAAATAARTLGLTVTDPTVLYSAFSVVVHLKPSPVVARVPMNLPEYFTDVEAADRRQQREFDVAAWLVAQGHPAVAPSPLVPLKPVQQDGFSMTFWQYVEKSPGDVDYLGGTKGTPVLTSRAGFEAVFPSATIQPIHGDAPAYNVIPTADGVLWSDFEDVTLGPIEWDQAGFGPDLGKVYDEAAAALGRPQLDRRVQQVMDTARVLQVMVCTPLVPRLPELGDGIRMFVGQWRSMPFAGGLG